MKDAIPSSPEVVIIRRTSTDDSAAVKGGAWKIAYADFVTAMMTFFLVMWLINSANDATKAQVASYFNPIKLSDVRTNEKGLHDPSSLKQNGMITASQVGPTNIVEFSQPNTSEKPVDRSREFRSGVSDAPGDTISERIDETVPSQPPPNAEADVVHDPFERAAKLANQASQAVTSSDSMPDGPVNEIAPSPTERAKKSAERINELIKAKMGDSGVSVEIHAVEDLVLISLVDEEAFSMFSSGSAEPLPAARSLLALIGKVLEQNPGEIVIRGHTDSVPFRGGQYDNWQLSTDRAHAAQVMLVEAGLSSSRLRRIEGIADRSPRNRERPDAPENRRIDILLNPK